MGKIYEMLRGKMRIEVCGAYVEGLLNAAALEAVELWDIECVDDFTLRVNVYEPDYRRLQAIAEKCMCQLKTISLKGGSKDRKMIKRRWGLLAFLLVSAALLFVSSLFVWEIDVVGNEKLSRGQVLRALSRSGVDLGSYRYSISADLVRSSMMQQLPELGWMTVNINGSRAVAVIVERQEKPEIYAQSDPADIVAAKTGIIKRMSVENGKPVVSPGASVLEGELLVSGVMDSLSNGSKFVRAKAKVMADTWHELSAVCPEEEELKEPGLLSHSRFAIIFGKRRINLYFDSGKAIDGCDKIIREYKLGVEGLFALPVTLVREELIPYETQPGRAYDSSAMAGQLEKQLLDSVEGEVLSRSFSQGKSGGLYVLTLRSHCLEDIALAVDIPG